MLLLNPVTFPRFKVRNRIIRSATCEYMALDDGRPTERLVKLYKELADGEIGIVISGFVYVLPNGKATNAQAGIYTDEFIPDWMRVTNVFKDTQTLFLMQIVHGGRQVRIKYNPGPVWAPSAIPDPTYKTEPLEMTLDDIEYVKDAFIQAAKRAEEAGFNGIQLHAAHGYLLSQFLSPYTNKRDDEYGGSRENRCRIVIDIVKGIRDSVGTSFIISAKVNGEDYIDGGLRLEDSIYSIQLMKDAGLDMVEVSSSMSGSKYPSSRSGIDKITDEGYLRKHASEVKKKAKILTASVGGYRSLAFMDQVVQSGDADFVSLCRPLINDPGLIIEFREGKQRSGCISCNKCFNPRGVACVFRKGEE